MARAADEGRGPRLAYTRWFNSQVAPGVLCQLEVCRANWDFKRYLRSRKFFRLNLKSDLKKVLPRAAVARSLAAGRNGKMVSESVIDQYETRGARNIPPPAGPNPLFACDTWTPELWGGVDA